MILVDPYYSIYRRVDVPEVQERLLANGWEPVGKPHTDAADRLLKERRKEKNHDRT